MSAAQGSAPAGVSVVIPVFNERDNLPLLHERLVASLAPLGRPWEILYVDDGSFDGSTELLEGLAASEPRVRAIVLARNFGQTPALAAGIDHASHDVIVTMDADLQNDPADIPRLLAAIDGGASIVSGWRRNRRDPWLTRVLPSLVANVVIARVTGVRIHDLGCTLKAYRRKLFQSFQLVGDMHRFLPVFGAAAGGRLVEIEVAHAPRHAGASKYGLSRTWKVLLDLIAVKFLLDFGTKPMRLFGAMGFVLCAFGVVAGATTLVQRAVDPTAFVHRNPLILLAVFLFLLGVQSIQLGLLAEIGIRTYQATRGGRAYVVDRVLGGGRGA